MERNENDNLVELFGRFLSPAETRQAVQDIEAGERLLAACPSPVPDPRAVAAIQAAVRAAAEGRRRSIIHIGRRVAAVAAMVAVVALIGVLSYMHRGPSGHISRTLSWFPGALWESEDIAGDDVELASFTTQVQQIEDQLRLVQGGEADTDGELLLNEMEIEVQEIASDFWKG